MLDFDFFLRTKIYFGKDRHLQIADIVKEYDFSNVFIIVGQNHAQKSGLLQQTTNLLTKKKIKYTFFSGIRPNPEIDDVRNALVLAQANNPDLILAIGGGSVIDSAKLIAASFYGEEDPFVYVKEKREITRALPIGVVLTHSSAGSEMSKSAVISEADNYFKEGFRSELLRPLFVVANPELTNSLSMYQTAIGIVDSFMHSLERYFCASAPIELADRFAEAIFITLKESAEQLLIDSNDYVARANVMLASSMSHNDLTSLGKKTYMSAHQLEHAISALYPEIPHGHGLAIIWPAWAKYYLPLMVDKFDRFARVVFNLTNNDKITNGLAGITALTKLFSDLGLSLTLRSVGVTENDIPVLANIVTKNATRELYHDTKKLNTDEIIAIYRACY